MELVYSCNPSLPSLAWLARVKEDKVEVQHGEKVETHERFFVEGAWGGNFLEGEFDTAEWFCGTGAVLRGDTVVFASPTGMHAGLFMLEGPGQVMLSNSLPLLMASEGFRYDPSYLGYEKFFNFNILQGFRKYDPKVHAIRKTDDGSWTVDESIQMVLFRNVTVQQNGTINVAVKPETKGFESFEEYYARLVDTMKRLAENAKDENRAQKYAVTSYISSGYDAATCAAVAKKAGAKKVLTFEAKGKYKNDSGVGAAKYLGYEMVVERNAYSFLDGSDFPEVKYLSGGDIGNSISSGAFEQDMRDHLVFSGENGDFVWGRTESFQTINDEIHIVWRNSEFGLCESHLHQEYIPVPMTSYGIRHWPDLFRISNSDEMASWSLGCEYDRPIPRRILESEGLPRETFGMEKHGAGFFYAYDWKKRILSRMSPASGRSFVEYMKEHRKMAPVSAYVEFLWTNKANYWNALMKKLHIGLTVKIPDQDVERRNAVTSPFAVRYLIPWAGDYMIGEYKKAIEGR